MNEIGNNTLEMSVLFDDYQSVSLDSNLFDDSTDRLRGKKIIENTVGGNDSSAFSLAGKGWTVITFPFQWVYQKIMTVIRWVFPGLFKVKVLDELSFSVVQKFIFDQKNAIQSLRADIAELKIISEGIESDEGMKKLRRLYSYHYEIYKSYRAVEDLLRESQYGLHDNRLTEEQKIDLGEQLFELISAHKKFKEKVVENRVDINLLYFGVENVFQKQELNDCELWFLRDYLYVLQFMKTYQALLTGNLNSDSENLNLDKKQLQPAGKQIIELQTVIKKKENFLKQSQALAVKSLRGILNLGQTCYMNSSLQVLLGTRLSDLLGADAVDARVETPLLTALQDFRAIYRLKNKALRDQIIRPAALLLRSSIAASEFAPTIIESNIHDQHDASEVIEAFLNAIGHHFNLQVKTMSLEGGGESNTETTTNCILQVSMDASGGTMQTLINHAQVEEKDDPENPFRQFSHFKNEYKITGEIPDVIVVQLKRMGYDTRLNRRTKIEARVTWDSDRIDLREWLDPALLQEGENTTYRLVAYVNHRGLSLDYGHYTANVQKQGRYYQCDDNSYPRLLGTDSEMDDREQAYLFVLERV